MSIEEIKEKLSCFYDVFENRRGVIAAGCLFIFAASALLSVILDRRSPLETLYSKLFQNNKSVFSKDNKQDAVVSKPNIVFIQIDSLRADHMGVYGYGKNTTPFLDSFFQQGAVFKNAFAPAPFTFQSDAAIFSGVFPSENNIADWRDIINDGHTLLPRILSFYGYKTYAFVSPSLWPSFGFDKSFGEYKMNTSLKNIANRKKEVAEIFRQGQSPFFIFWHIYDVHLPYYTASNEFYPGEYQGSLSPQANFFAVSDASSIASQGTLTPNQPNIWSYQTKEGLCVSTKDVLKPSKCAAYKKLTNQDLEYIRAAYDTGIKYTDNQLKEFFELIMNTATYPNTIFAVSAEHGEDLGEHGLVFHGDIYNSNIHVPLAIVAPKFGQKKIENNVSTLDIAPTILSLAGIMLPQNSQGKDLYSLMLTGERIEERPIFTERAPFDEYSVVVGNWKYILRNSDKNEKRTEDMTDFMKAVLNSDGVGKRPDELYDLSNDPLEQNNLIGTGIKQETELKILVSEFREKMRKARQSNQQVKNNSAPQAFPIKIMPYP